MIDNKKLTHENIISILSPYGIKTIDSFKLLSGGSENTNYLIKSVISSYVLTLSEQKTSDEANKLALLLSHLKNNNFSSSILVETKEGNAITLWNNKPVMIKEYLEGTICDDLPLTILTYLGEQLALLHNLPIPEYLPKKLSYGVEKFNDVEVYAPKSDFFTWLKETRHYIESYITSSLPKVMIHSDIFTDNIIVSPDKTIATIMDFEEATHYYRVFDIGMMIVGTCRNGDKLSLEKAKKLLEGYQRKITLTKNEIDALQAFAVYGATATAFWRHKNFNYVNIDKTMKNHYQEMMILAINIMSISNNEFQKQLAV